jgi:hypothetical protein
MAAGLGSEVQGLGGPLVSGAGQMEQLLPSLTHPPAFQRAPCRPSRGRWCGPQQPTLDFSAPLPAALVGSPLPAALVRRKDGRLLHHPRRQRAGARVCLFRGGAGASGDPAQAAQQARRATEPRRTVAKLAGSYCRSRESNRTMASAQRYQGQNLYKIPPVTICVLTFNE